MLNRDDFKLPVMAAVFVRQHENISADIELLNSVCMNEVKRSYKRKNVLWCKITIFFQLSSDWWVDSIGTLF